MCNYLSFRFAECVRKFARLQNLRQKRRFKGDYPAFRNKVLKETMEAKLCIGVNSNGLEIDS